MEYRRANRAFMFMMLATIAMTFLATAWYYTSGKEISIIFGNVCRELMVLIPAIAAVLYSGDSLGSVIPLKKFKITSALLSVLYVLALYPLISLVNSISMLFVENTVDSMMDSVLGMPIWLMILSIGIVGPFIEEVVFRGFFFHSYKKSGRILASIILSAVLFGLMHLNFNQFTYAAVMGVMFCLLVEATGSVWSSFLAHGLFNTLEVLFIYYSLTNFSDDVEAVEIGRDYGLLPTIGFYFLLAVIFTPIAICIVYKIAKIEGREAALNEVLHGKKTGGKLISIPLIIGAFLALVYMLLDALAQYI
ncbi:CPBP family intramembrane metalloprotease [Butyrivibrio sp. X503]|uniref:CPBP family intramembrane glutamic endopeptidase n=1 Tax=Butyrivibrio sp. X503 TaxID=2364878 RepID=UPI000EA99227|nr:type II CAAX endopeptidase family protein [Butyrivibrio sp. X503]RKM58424.1 CPBP family intramembrane metalloprotease [Butyrivibrio sp. X503]